MKVLMWPQVGSTPSGISTLVEKYGLYLPRYGVELVGPDEEYDVEISHAGVRSFSDPGGPNLSICHGLYWTADYKPPPGSHEWEGNRAVVDNVRHARQVTVPSRWVAETFQRDMKMAPHILPHGVDWDEWQGGERGSYVLWNKNRKDGVCNPEPVNELARRFPDVSFVSTFINTYRANITVTGLLPHERMVPIVKGAGVYLATTKETFGIGTLEAMASGVPVLGFAHGGVLDMVRHKVTGYLARPGDYADLQEGLAYCIENKKRLGEAAREAAMAWRWPLVMERLVEILQDVARPIEPAISVIIPVFNKEHTVEQAIRSALNQTHRPIEVVVVNDGSTDGSTGVVERVAAETDRVRIITQENRGVAIARNRGVAESRGNFFVCLDGDDAIGPGFIEATLGALLADNSLGIAYTKITTQANDGTTGVSAWPNPFDADEQLAGRNQIPTACLVRRSLWARHGGYRQRYAPRGAGAEDADLWTRMVAAGAGAALASDDPIFYYRIGQGLTSKDYVEPPWRDWHPYIKDKIYPFAAPVNDYVPVRQYDSPILSVIIPVGPGHVQHVFNALDSLEAQTFRDWEVVVINDSNEDVSEIMAPYPYARVFHTHKAGAGAARNAGVQRARGSLLLFLDADDYLTPGNTLDLMVRKHQETGYAIYSNYYGVNPPELNGRETVVYDDGKRVVVEGRMAPFECRRVMDQPQIPPYVWATVTTLVPRAWHDRIGGFDEKVPAWEDWLYMINLARAGLCFEKLDHFGFVYNFDKGSRRVAGQLEHESLIPYMRGELVRVGGDMACGCAKGVSARPAATANGTLATSEAKMTVMYVPGHKGKSYLYGFSRPIINYGRRQEGDIIEVVTRDVVANATMPNKVFACANCGDALRVVGREAVVCQSCSTQPGIEQPVEPKKASAPASDNEVIDDLSVVSGIGPTAIKRLNEAGIKRLHQLEIIARNKEALHRYVPHSSNMARVQKWFKENYVKAA